MGVKTGGKGHIDEQKPRMQYCAGARIPSTRSRFNGVCSGFRSTMRYMMYHWSNNPGWAQMGSARSTLVVPPTHRRLPPTSAPPTCTLAEGVQAL